MIKRLLLSVCLATIFAPIEGHAALFGTEGLDPAFCQTKTVRQTVVYVDDMMMVEGKTDWATKISNKLRATLMPGERVTVVRLMPKNGQSLELWTGCWASFTAAQKADVGSKNYFFGKNPIDSLGEQQTFFMRDFGAALTKVYLDAKRPESAVHTNADHPPQKQILRALASDEGRFSNSQMTIRAVVYSDMMENSDLGNVFQAIPSQIPNYAEKLGSHLRKSVFYAFGVAEFVTGAQSVQERAKEFWNKSLKTVNATVSGFGADLNVANSIPVSAATYDVEMKFDGQMLDGKMSLLTDPDGNLVDSWLAISRLTIAGLTGTYKCAANACKLDAATTSGLATTSPNEIVTLTGNPTELSGQLGVKGTSLTFPITGVPAGSI